MDKPIINEKYFYKYGELVKVRIKEINEKHIKVYTPYPEYGEGIVFDRLLELDPELEELTVGQSLYVSYLGDYNNHSIFGDILRIEYLWEALEGTMNLNKLKWMSAWI